MKNQDCDIKMSYIIYVRRVLKSDINNLIDKVTIEDA
jgi:hypothetical protein